MEREEKRRRGEEEKRRRDVHECTYWHNISTCTYSWKMRREEGEII